MKSSDSVVALVPMRHHSARVEGKNYRLIGGTPLYAFILRTLSEVPSVSRIVVDTDSPIIAAGIKDGFPTVKVIDRPGHLTADEVPMNEILLHDVDQVQADFYLQTHSTNPLLTSKTISRAIDAFFSRWPERNSLFSVTPVQARLWTAEGQPVNHDPQVLLQTQDLAPLMIENSCLYIFSRDGLLSRRNRLGERPILFELGQEEAIDIDTEPDFRLAEQLILSKLSAG